MQHQFAMNFHKTILRDSLTYTNVDLQENDSSFWSSLSNIGWLKKMRTHILFDKKPIF